jgi:hypothetical protein
METEETNGEQTTDPDLAENPEPEGEAESMTNEDEDEDEEFE